VEDSGDYIFTKRADGTLEFKGDFEGLYRSEPDPWGQSGTQPRTKEYYTFSRRRLLLLLNGLPWKTMLEVGCGCGYVADQIDRTFYPGRRVSGCDISQTAVNRAKKKFPNPVFFVADFATPGAWINPLYTHRYDVVVLSQMLWYVLHGSCLRATFENALMLLEPHGHIVVQNAFLSHQEYGRGVINGFDGLLRYALDHLTNLQAVSASYDNFGRYAPLHDGLLVLSRRR
jgi:SAM-dependent methyltransferase